MTPTHPATDEHRPVVFVMIDGLRPDAIGPAHCPNLRAMQSRGAWTLQARSTLPSITLPCHMTIFHSVPPARHGITTNDWHPMARPVPGLVEVAKRYGKRCAFVHNWEPLRDLNRPETLEFSYFRNNLYSYEGDDLLTDVAIDYLRQDRPDFLFLYLGTVDIAGHVFGWMSDEYLRQAERQDGNLGRVLDSLPAGTHVLVQADHGGHDRMHGTDLPEDITIPWLVMGSQIRAGHEILAPISLLDTAPTLAALLGVPAHGEWEGRVPEELWTSRQPA